MPLVTLQRSHLVIASAILAVGALFAFRGPWSAQAAGNGVPTSLPQQVVYVDQYGRPLQIMPVETARAVPASYVAAPAYAPAYAPAVEPRPYVRPASITRTSSAPPAVRPIERGRSWKKSALIIGGSAGTGAGVGALIGGKKGAAIGAALGGGSAALYEAVKR